MVGLRKAILSSVVEWSPEVVVVALDGTSDVAVLDGWLAVDEEQAATTAIGRTTRTMTALFLSVRLIPEMMARFNSAQRGRWLGKPTASASLRLWSSAHRTRSRPPDRLVRTRLVSPEDRRCQTKVRPSSARRRASPAMLGIHQQTHVSQRVDSSAPPLTDMQVTGSKPSNLELTSQGMPPNRERKVDLLGETAMMQRRIISAVVTRLLLPALMSACGSKPASSTVVRSGCSLLTKQEAAGEFAAGGNTLHNSTSADQSFCVYPARSAGVLMFTTLSWDKKRPGSRSGVANRVLDDDQPDIASSRARRTKR